MHLLSGLGMVGIIQGDFERTFVCSMLMACLGLGSPPSRPSPSGRRYYDRLRLPLHLLGSLRFRSIPDTLRAPVGSCSSRLAGGLGVARPTPGCSCIPVCRSRSSTARSWRFSQVPRLPLCVHAPLADPGGVLVVCHITTRSHAFQQPQTVGFPHPKTGYPCFPMDHN